MTMNHEFVLADKLWLDKNYYNAKKINIRSADFTDRVEIHDDIIWYIYDTLRWIPTEEKLEDGHIFLNLYGITVIDCKLAPHMKNIFEAWANLFRYAPDNIELTGSSYRIEGTDESGWEKLKIDKNALLKSFNALIDYSEKLIANNELRIVHFGI